jgi:hypothetical protein
LLSHKFGASPEKFKDETAIQEKIDEQKKSASTRATDPVVSSKSLTKNVTVCIS